MRGDDSRTTEREDLENLFTTFCGLEHILHNVFYQSKEKGAQFHEGCNCDV